jgi:hypothetical protein
MLTNRIGPSFSEPRVVNTDGSDKRRLADSLWEDATPLLIPAKV